MLTACVLTGRMSRKCVLTACVLTGCELRVRVLTECVFTACVLTSCVLILIYTLYVLFPFSDSFVFPRYILTPCY